MLKIFILPLYFLVFAPQVTGQEEVFDKLKEHQVNQQDKKQAEQYLHQGKRNRIIEEECEKLSNGKSKGAGCLAEEVQMAGQVGGATFDSLVQVVAQMYGTFFGAAQGAMGGGNKFNKEKQQDLNNDGTIDKNEKSQTKKDICGYIPMATEIVSRAIAAGAQNNFSNNQEMTDFQKEALYASIRAHKDRKKAADIQKVGWGSTALCYIAYITTPGPGLKADWSVYAKAAAANGLSLFYGIKASRHSNYAKVIKKIADELPGKGDCNPITQRHCFCQEETSEKSDPANYEKYCLAQALRGTGRKNPTVCVDEKNQSDPQCLCKKRGTCMENRLHLLAGQLNLGNSFMKNALSGLQELNSGHFDAGKIGHFATNNTALAKNFLDKNKNYPGAPRDLLKGATVPAGTQELEVDPAVAAYANVRSNGANAQAAFSRFNGGAENSINTGNAQIDQKIASIVESDFRYASKKSKSANHSFPTGGANEFNFENPFLKGKTQQGPSGGVIIEEEMTASYAQKALNNADVSTQERPLFDIITHRYKNSAWKTFKVID